MSRVPFGGSGRAVAALAAGSVAVAVVAAEVGGTDEGASLCTVRHITGGYCPGCGAMRAARHLLHGQVGASWRDHPWVLLAALQLVFVATVLGVVALRPRSLVVRRSWFTALAVGNALALIVIWSVRVGVGAIPSPF